MIDLCFALLLVAVVFWIMGEPHAARTPSNCAVSHLVLS